VDEHGCFVGMLSPADVFRWVEAGCSNAVVYPVAACPYQVRGRLLNGEEGVMCMLADGSCPFQTVRPVSGGRHLEVCIRPEVEKSPFGKPAPYMTTEVVTGRRQATLPELVRKIVDARADRLVVLDESDRPIGIVSATTVLNAVADGDGYSVDGPHK
jgi:hypothetical protein